jgi:hypothetical protein
MGASKQIGDSAIRRALGCTDLDLHHLYPIFHGPQAPYLRNLAPKTTFALTNLSGSHGGLSLFVTPVRSTLTHGD